MILAVRHQTVPNFSAFHQRAMVIDGDIRDADTLDDLCMLAVAKPVRLLARAPFDGLKIFGMANFPVERPW